MDIFRCDCGGALRRDNALGKGVCQACGKVKEYVFISYCGKDREYADQIRQLLMEHSIPVWMAPYDIPSGAEYHEIIRDTLINCSCLLLLLTDAAQNGAFVRRELENGILYDKIILPVQFGDFELNSRFKFLLKGLDILKIIKDELANGFDQTLISRVSKAFGNPDSPILCCTESIFPPASARKLDFPSDPKNLPSSPEEVQLITRNLVEVAQSSLKGGMAAKGGFAASLRKMAPSSLIGCVAAKESLTTAAEPVSAACIPNLAKSISGGFRIAAKHREKPVSQAVTDSDKAYHTESYHTIPSLIPVTLNKIHFSALAPQTLIPGRHSIIDIYMYEPEFRRIVDQAIQNSKTPLNEKQSGTLKVAEGTRIRILLTSPDLSIPDGDLTQTWYGEYLDFSFPVSVPIDFSKDQILFSAAVYFDDVIATRLSFMADCHGPSRQHLDVVRSDILSAFISYASQDRARVAMIVQGMKKARPDLDLFFDVESLRSGEDWEKVLYREIDNRDLLYLCWSHFASQSKWVDTEWRYAMDHKGINSIEPIPIDPPEACPPPAELCNKHFNDKLLYIIRCNEQPAAE